MGLPRFWATIWALYALGHAAEATKRKRLGYVELLYQFSDALRGPGALDDALSGLDIARLGEILEAYFVSIRNRPVVSESSENKWQTAFTFVHETVLRLAKSDQPIDRLRIIEMRLNRLGLLYQQLHISKKRSHDTLRALPATVVEALYEMLDPAAPHNPFRGNRSRWRAFVTFVVLLHQGLRRGELLILPADAVKHAVDNRRGTERYWISIAPNTYQAQDTRYSTPSIKTEHSIRQIPVSQLTARIIQEYVENHRGKPEHSFLMSSQYGRALSAESVTKMFQTISDSLPASVLKDLSDRTGKRSISAHDFRHTCAVVRLNQLLTDGDSMDEALQKMRSFFGWSRSSDMPRKYARAVFEDRLASVWNNVFDDRVAILRAVPAHIK